MCPQSMVRGNELPQELVWPERPRGPRGPRGERQSLPVYSGKQMVSGDFLIFSSKMSFLLRNRMMDVSVNHLLLQMLSKSFSDSCMRFCNRVERRVRAGGARGPDPPRPVTKRGKRREGPPTQLKAPPGTETGGSTRTRTWSLLHSTRRWGGGGGGGAGHRVGNATPPLKRAGPGQGSGVTRGTLAHREDMHHARGGRGRATIHTSTRDLRHADFSTGVSFGFASRGGRVHTFSWETLTEDQEILELIQSWKQTPGGQRRGSDLAVALVWLETGWVGWAMRRLWMSCF